MNVDAARVMPGIAPAVDSIPCVVGHIPQRPYM
ncbi:hypothetical protein P3T43_004802 [Paraburkholderia sp. GAS41]|jgi:hypothetical protein